MYSLTPTGFLQPDGTNSWVILAAGAGSVGAEWERRQDLALPGYVHELDAVPLEKQHLYQLFSRYTALALLEGRGKRILDVGCGIGSRLPPYVRPLESVLISDGIQYVGLDPINRNLQRRDYLFACGRIEDLASTLETRFDIFLFATSLDHMEDTARAAAAVRKLSAARALGVFWVGLHDPEFVAEELGRKWFGKLYSSLNPVLFLLRAALVAAVAVRRYPNMVRRAWRLKRGLPLDEYHFAYFTSLNVHSHLQRFGEVRDFTRVVGTNSAFATVEIRGEPAR